jgi:hypothetical protein
MNFLVSQLDCIEIYHYMFLHSDSIRNYAFIFLSQAGMEISRPNLLCCWA